MKDLLDDLARWLKACPLWKLRKPKAKTAKPGEEWDQLTEAEVSYSVSAAFVEGSTVQDLASAGAAATAIWIARKGGAHAFDLYPVKHGRYQVEAEMTFRFSPLEDDTAVVPLYSGKNLVDTVNDFLDGRYPRQ